MKKIISVFLVILLFPTSSSCEKDDVCDSNTVTTPKLIIEFYDITNPTIKKNVTNLAIIGDGITEPYQVFNAESKIEIPLKTTDDLTKFRFVLNYNNDNPSLINEDYVTFNYQRENSYISRACGFKTYFILETENPFIITDNSIPDGLWIKNSSIIQRIIFTENETHLKISF